MGTTVQGDSPSAIEADATTTQAESIAKDEPTANDELIAKDEPIAKDDPISLWDKAYDSLKTGQPRLVSDYEDLLSRVLIQNELQTSLPAREEDEKPVKNEIPDDIVARRQKLLQITELGLKHAKDTKLSTTILGHEVVLQDIISTTGKAVDWASTYVSDAIKDVPYGPAVMAGISLILPLLMNPAAVESANREGLSYVTSQMHFYNAMEAYLPGLNGDMKDVLTTRIEHLYQLVIEFQLESVLRFYRTRTKNYLTAIVDYDQWDAKRSRIQKEESDLQLKLSNALSAESSGHLKNLCKEAEESRQELAGILLGILNVTQRMNRRLSTAENRNCIAALQASDPCDDKDRIQVEKGGLHLESFRWILDNPEFQKWRGSAHEHLLWIRGDPGKGKTMLLCGIIDELIESVGNKGNVAFFFCQEPDDRINSATAVLRGLIYMLVKQQRVLFSHVRDRFDDYGPKRFEGTNAWTALLKIFRAILNDPQLQTTYLVIDALDECADGMDQLLGLIADSSSSNMRVKWIVSSRNWSNIERKLHQAKFESEISLELNSEAVSRAVKTFVHFKVQELAQKNEYTDETRAVIYQNLSEKTEDTFLWVALVCKELEKVPAWQAKSVLDSFPDGLEALYHRMMVKIRTSRTASLCYQILSVVSLARLPLTLAELVTVSELPPDACNEEAIKDIVGDCGSFLTLKDGVTVRFVHQSAKDFLVKSCREQIYSSGIFTTHRQMFSRSMQALATTLRRDICGLKEPGILAKDVEHSQCDLLDVVKYSCLYWTDHLIASGPGEEEDLGLIDMFLQRDYLHWLEALSLLGCMSTGVSSMMRLEKFLMARNVSDSLMDRAHDACRFLQHHKSTIELSPLQVYASALVFSPVKSTTRRQFAAEEPDWISTSPLMDESWGDCLMTLDGSNGSLQSVAWSQSGQVASTSHDGTIKIWDTATGLCTLTLRKDRIPVSSVKWRRDNKLATVSADGTVVLWDTSLGISILTRKSESILLPRSERIVTLKGYFTLESKSSIFSFKDTLESFISAAWSHDEKLALADTDGRIHIWDSLRDKCPPPLDGHDSKIFSMAWSRDGRLASAASDGSIKIWNMTPNKKIQTIFAHDQVIYCVAWSEDGSRLASASMDNTIKVWNTETGQCTTRIQAQTKWIRALAWSPDGRLAGADNETIKIWDPITGWCLSRLEGHSHQVWSLSWTADGTRLASASRDGSVKVWDVAKREDKIASQGHSHTVNAVAWSPDKTLFASASDDHTIKIWKISSGKCLWTLTGHSHNVVTIAWSNDGFKLASGSEDKMVKIWDTTAGHCITSLEGHDGAVRSVAWSKDGSKIASASDDQSINIWDSNGGPPSLTLKGHTNCVGTVAWSEDGTRLASASRDRSIKIWETSTGNCLSGFKSDNFFTRPLSWSKDGMTLVSSSDLYKNIQIWDVVNEKSMLTLDLNREIFWSQFDESQPHILHTDIGSFDLNPTLLAESVEPGSITSKPVLPQGYGVDETGLWITYRGERRLRLPSEYKIGCSAILPGRIAIGCNSGRVLIFGTAEA
ncbi:NACHT-domain-containing protein [Penicillium odoratum]|uniref:NACHT-domain-containing protein n=1 Tax=Penicillium odoratum TaxID=1167516 RepID=UPI0025484F7C|nr:NACHT-domain-containing protein [Penicillium odoratum]KAJ5777332.1 NACHT-domain-containing protein [Penicillium odoratum]